MILDQITIFFLIGLFAGCMSGIFGIGGGSIRIPLLNLAGLPLLSAFAINIVVIPFSSAVGAISQRANIDKKIASYMVIGGTLGSITGAYLAGLIPTLTLAIIFVSRFHYNDTGNIPRQNCPEILKKNNPGFKNIVISSFCLNLITGMRGGSGGALFPPFLRAMHFNIHKAIATSLFVTILQLLPL